MAHETRMAFVWGRLGVGLCLAGAASLAFVLGNVESVLKADLSSALSQNPATQVASTVRNQPNAEAIAWAASEDEWLGFAGQPRVGKSGGVEVNPVSWPEAVTQGDRMTLTWQGTERVFDIVDVRDVTQTPTHIDTRTATEPRSGLIMVTGRLAGTTDGATIRFVIEQPGESEVRHLTPVKAESSKREASSPAALGPPRTL